MEPAAAHHWADIATRMITSGATPVVDKRNVYTNYADFGTLFRVDQNGAVQKDGPVQVIRMSDPIAKYDYCGSPGSQTYEQLIKATEADPTISSILLWIDSPGGQADGTEALSNTIKASKKPVVAYTDGMMASAAYWIGSSAKEIIASGSNNGFGNSIGSIGTMVMYKDDSAKLEKEGVKIHTIFATESTDKWSDHRAIQAGDYSKIMESLDGYNNSFLNTIKTNRAGKINLDAENVLTGKVYDAKKAMKYGLIDRVGDFQYAVKRSLQLSKQQSLFNTTTMAFENTMQAAGTDQFEVIEGGFLLTEESLNNIEATIATNATRIAELEAQVSQFTANTDASTTAATLAADQLATAQATISTQAARIAELEALPGATISETVKTGDDKVPGAAEKKVSAVTAEANKLRSIQGKPPIDY